MGNQKVTFRDYSLLGKESKLAVEEGLADAEWYRSPVSRVDMRKLLIRKDGPAIRDTFIWFALIIGSGYLVFLLWGSWFAIFPYIVYSVLYASTSDSRWHETSHGTAFKTDWMNNVLYEIASFMVLRQSTVWRWSHARHHSDTIIRGRDPEIAVPRPPDLKKIAMGFFGLSGAIPEVRRILLHARGRIDPGVATYLPKHEYAKVILKARIYILIYLLVISLSVYFRSLLPLMYIGLPTLLGGWLMPVYGLTQHAGLQENVLDHRLNCRTVYMNRIHRFLYWNMNYHIEHHMFPLVPYHALPDLHELVKEDYPVPYKGIIDAWKEIIPALLRQVKDPSYYVQRKVPERKENIPAGVLRRAAADNDSLANGKIAVCSTDDLPEGEVMRFDFRQKTYAVYRTIANEYFATDGFCTHGNAHLAEGVLIGDTIECHKHNGRYNLRDGSPARIPVITGINTHRVEVSSGKIILDLAGPSGEKSGSEEAGKIFRVISNRNLTTFIKELVLSPLDGQKFSYRPGQYVQITIPPFKAVFRDFNIDEPFGRIWKEAGFLDYKAENSIYSKRNYSLVTNPGKDQYLKFDVRISLPPSGSQVTAGAGSSYVFNLKTGDEVELTGPFGNFLIRDSLREMVYLGGGAGMAPLRSHLSYLFESEKTSRKVSFWYGARSSADLFYLDYFEKLQQDNQNFSFHVALSEPGQYDHMNRGTGFIHEYLRDNYLSTHAQPSEIEYYLCGPPPMIEAALKMLKSFGINDDMISFDEF
jgi:fatty acid desaturase/NAD(P)H-flavin reductase/nitrite reductase/ring-hydroxylating ferredoxin subunit